MTISAYETLYESSIAYGVRKALVAEQKRIDLDAKLRELAMVKRELQQQVESLKHTIESTQARSVQRREGEEKVHAEEVCFAMSQLLFRFGPQAPDVCWNLCSLV
jgi:dynein light intermediate chain